MPSRRRFLGTTAAGFVGLGSLAGCQGTTNDSTTSPGESTTATDDTSTTTEQSTTTEGESYTVSMSPVGDVSFDAVPENVFTVFPQYLDMAVALGHGDAVNAVYVPEMSGTTMNHYYHHLGGVTLDWSGLADPLSDGLSKEHLYALDSDVHLADPAWASTQPNWSTADVDGVATNVAPWFGNFFSGTHGRPPDGYSDYDYYTLWELFGHVADVFQERDRYEALAQVHAELVDHVETNLPPKSERPTVVRATLSRDGSTFWTYHLNEPGYWLADTRPLGATDAFADQGWDGLWGTVDYEAMLEADPDVILHLWGMTPNYSMADTIEMLESDPNGQQLTAVQEGRVYPAGMRYQGPIMNLFQIEMGAKQLYPDVFGDWPDYEDGEHYPDIPTDEQLFDRDRVAGIVTGEGG